MFIKNKYEKLGDDSTVYTFSCELLTVFLLFYIHIYASSTFSVLLSSSIYFDITVDKNNGNIPNSLPVFIIRAILCRKRDTISENSELKFFQGTNHNYHKDLSRPVRLRFLKCLPCCVPRNAKYTFSHFSVTVYYYVVIIYVEK